MEIFGLYGKSGTGKSHKAREIASRYRIDAVLDDGLLIVNRRSVAGKSAKNERTAYAATKTAIFFSEPHRQEVMRYLRRASPHRMLVIGTSRRMVERIVRRLELPDPVLWLQIESFQSADEIRLAQDRRRIGYHVIPMRPADAGRTFQGWFGSQIIRFGWRSEEVTLVKPRYIRDVIMVHPQCVEDIAAIVADPLLPIRSVEVMRERVTVRLSARHGCTVEHVRQWQARLTAELRGSLEIPYTVDIEWCAFIPEKRR